MTDDLYAILGVDRNATRDEIGAAYRKLSREAHPDAGGSEERQKKLSHAYSVLKDPDARRRYDETGSAQQMSEEAFRARLNGIANNAISQALAEYERVANLPFRGPGIEFNLVERAREILEDRVTAAEAMVSMAKKRLDRYEKLRKRVSGPVIETVTDKALLSASEAYSNLRRDVYEFKAALDVLNGEEHSPEEDETWRDSTMNVTQRLVFRTQT